MTVTHSDIRTNRLCLPAQVFNLFVWLRKTQDCQIKTNETERNYIKSHPIPERGESSGEKEARLRWLVDILDKGCWIWRRFVVEVKEDVQMAAVTEEEAWDADDLLWWLLKGGGRFKLAHQMVIKWISSSAVNSFHLSEVAQKQLPWRLHVSVWSNSFVQNFTQDHSSEKEKKNSHKFCVPVLKN